MFLQRTALTLARRTPVRALAKRSFATTVVRRNENQPQKPTEVDKKLFKSLDEIQSEEDLIGPGAKPGTVPTDLEQATGLERLELLGKMQGVDIFDMRPLDASRLGTKEDPIIVKSAGPEQYVGCTGVPADSHNVVWLTLSRDRPLERCGECGNCIKMEYIGEEDAHDHHGYEEPKTFVDYVKPEYWYR
ncbi:hypothetical protein VTO42DRAFT_6890 [Malbranchea cinnamomea]